ncbi:MAG: hypothetical protein ACK5ME_09550 [Parahaliea sp.]
MRFLIFITALVLLAMLGYMAVLLGMVPGDYLGFDTGELALPASTAELGESIGLIDGVFSSFAMILALITLFLQQRALRQQSKESREALAVSAYSAQLTFLTAEIDRLGMQADRAAQQAEDKKLKSNSDDEEIRNLYDIARNSRNKQKEHRKQAEKIHHCLYSHLPK